MTFTRAQYSDNHDIFSPNVDPFGEQFATRGTTSLGSLKDVQFGSHLDNDALDFDVGFTRGAVKVGASHAGTSCSNAGPMLLGRERVGIRVECKDSDQVGRGSSVAMWTIS